MNLLITLAANYLIYVLLTAVIVGGFIHYRPNYPKLALYLFQFGLACLFGYVCIALLQALFHTDRPFVALGTQPLIPHPPTPSFPSGHATYSGIMTGFLWQLNEKWGALAFVALILICTARVLALVHYPIDVVVGACLGILHSFAVPYLLARRSTR